MQVKDENNLKTFKIKVKIFKTGDILLLLNIFYAKIYKQKFAPVQFMGVRVSENTLFQSEMLPK